MRLSKNDLKIETTKGTGPGGQKKNKVETACRIKHLPTGITAYADERTQKHSRRAAMADLEEKLANLEAEQKALKKKGRRDQKVKNPERAIRTYDFKSGVVKDHRTGKKASIKDILTKGKLDLLK